MGFVFILLVMNHMHRKCQQTKKMYACVEWQDVIVIVVRERRWSETKSEQNQENHTATEDDPNE